MPNHAWEDVADDVSGAIEKAVQPLLKKAVDDIYAGLLDATQDYLRDNLAFNIASRIDTAEREARSARETSRDLRELVERCISYLSDAERETNWGSPTFGPSASEEMQEALDVALLGRPA